MKENVKKMHDIMKGWTKPLYERKNKALPAEDVEQTHQALLGPRLEDVRRPLLYWLPPRVILRVLPHLLPVQVLVVQAARELQSTQPVASMGSRSCAPQATHATGVWSFPADDERNEFPNPSVICSVTN